jgi:hypothetical protein
MIQIKLVKLKIVKGQSVNTRMKENSNQKEF